MFEGSNINGYVRMGTKKVTTAGSSQYWWGYATQVNYVGTLGSNHIEQFVIIKGQETASSDSLIQFYCNFNQAPGNNTNLMTSDCPRSDNSALANPVEPMPGRTNSSCSAVTPNSNFFQFQLFSPGNATEGEMNAVACFNMRSSKDTTTNVKGYSSGTTITYKAGYKVRALFNSTTVLPATGSSGVTDWLEYTIKDSGAVALQVSMAVTSIMSLIF